MLLGEMRLHVVSHARSPTLRDRASYDARNWDALLAAGVVREFESEAEPVPGVKPCMKEEHV